MGLRKITAKPTGVVMATGVKRHLKVENCHYRLCVSNAQYSTY